MDSPSSQPNMASQFALRVALQTMKERCISLQQRLTTVEDENQELRERLETEPPHATLTNATAGRVAENFQLRTQVAELNRQKIQLSEHINMVSAENRKLWSRLSKMAKEQNEPCAAGSDGGENSPRGASTASQNLIRSKTFTQHSPNPNLRHKLIAHPESSCDTKENSLEEVALDKEIAVGGAEACLEAATEAALGFAYINVDATTAIGSDQELNAETKRCIDGLEELRREALKQRNQLNAALSILENKIARPHCAECEKKAQKPEMADKSLETDESLNEMMLYNKQATVAAYVDAASYTTQHSSNASVTEKRLHLLQEKIQADELDRICPMCGKMFTSVVPFNSFREHVETHFIDDTAGSDVEASMERNFEFVSHAVGDF